MFQCSSASRKFLTVAPTLLPILIDSFSALQRAENSSLFRDGALIGVEVVSVLFSEPKIPHVLVIVDEAAFVKSFSALQRAENSSLRGKV